MPFNDPYFSRLKILGLETLERRRVINDLVLCYKIQKGHSDMLLNVAPGSSVTRGNNFKLVKHTCSIDVRKFFIAIELSTHETVNLILYSLHHQLIIMAALCNRGPLYFCHVLSSFYLSFFLLFFLA